jgi:hypothetical protein
MPGKCLAWNSCTNLNTPQNAGKPILVDICARLAKKKPKKLLCYRKPPEQEQWICIEADSYDLTHDKTCDLYRLKVLFKLVNCYKGVINPIRTGITEPIAFESLASPNFKHYINAIGHPVGGLLYKFCKPLPSTEYGYPYYVNGQIHPDFRLVRIWSSSAKWHDSCNVGLFDPIANDYDAGQSWFKVLEILKLDGTPVPCTIRLYKEGKQVHEVTFETGCPEIEEKEDEVCELEQHPSKIKEVTIVPPDYLELEKYPIEEGSSIAQFCVRVKKHQFYFNPIDKTWNKALPLVVFQACSDPGCESFPEVTNSCSDCSQSCPEGTCLECPSADGNICCIGADGKVLAVVLQNAVCSDSEPPTLGDL